MVSSQYFVITTTAQKFVSSRHIPTKQHCAIYKQLTVDDSWEQFQYDDYDLINNTLILNDEIASTEVKKIEVRVADGLDELDENPSDINIIVANIDDINTNANNIESINTNATNITYIVTVVGMQTAINSLYADKVTLDSLYADKTILDSIYADKATLDSLYADKATLDSLFADKETLDSIFADKITLDSLYADKVKLDAVFDGLTLAEIVGNDLSNQYSYIEDNGSITEEVEGGEGTSKIGIVADGIGNININATNIDSINTNASNINAINTNADNILDIQNAEENANIATAKAEIATTKAAEALASANSASGSAGQASTSVTNAQLKVWEAEAFKMTADSYATEAEDVFVKTYTSNGDGNFTATDTAEYSSKHWAEKASATSGDFLAQDNNLSDVTDIEASRTNLSVYSKDEVDTSIETVQGCCISNAESIANLATAQAVIEEDDSIAITTTQQTISINSTTPSTDTDIFDISDENDTVTFKTNASINFYSAMTFTSDINQARVVSVKVINVADDTVLKSFDVTLAIPNGDTETIAPTFLLTVGKNAIPNADLTVRFEIVADDTGYSLDTFKVVIASSSSYDVSTQANGIGYDNATSGSSATNVQDALDEALDLDLGGL